MEKSRLEGLEGMENPFCQIAGSDISPISCMSTQGQEGCFGCAASCKYCEKCKENFVDVPAVGFCSSCLAVALEQDKTKKLLVFKKQDRVFCQIYKSKIAISMCQATQGSAECRGCNVNCRICEDCKKRPSCFPAYGLCLTCSVAQFGEGWQPPTIQTQTTKIPAFSKELSKNTSTKLPILRLEADQSSIDRNKTIPSKIKQSSKELCVQCNTDPVRLKGSQVCEKCAKKILKNLTEGKSNVPALIQVSIENGMITSSEKNSMGFKIQWLEILIEVVGADTELGQLFTSIQADLKDLAELIYRFKKINNRWGNST